MLFPFGSLVCAKIDAVLLIEVPLKFTGTEYVTLTVIEPPGARSGREHGSTPAEHGAVAETNETPAGVGS